MPHAPRPAGTRIDLASALKVCSNCLGDLAARADSDGTYLFCTQCHQRTASPPVALAPPAVTPLVLPAAPATRATGEIQRTA